MHSLFIFKLLHNFFLCISEMLEIRLLVYTWTATDAVGCRTSLLRGYSLLLTTIRRHSEIETINIDYSKRDILADLNVLYTNRGIRGMHEEKDFEHPDSVFVILAVFVDSAMAEKSPPRDTRPYQPLRASTSADP